MALPQQHQRQETAQGHSGLCHRLENRGDAVGWAVERFRLTKMINRGCQVTAEEGGRAQQAMFNGHRRSVSVTLRKMQYLLRNLASGIRSRGMKMVLVEAGKDRKEPWSFNACAAKLPGAPISLADLWRGITSNGNEGAAKGDLKLEFLLVALCAGRRVTQQLEGLREVGCRFNHCRARQSLPPR